MSNKVIAAIEEKLFQSPRFKQMESKTYITMATVSSYDTLKGTATISFAHPVNGTIIQKENAHVSLFRGFSINPLKRGDLVVVALPGGTIDNPLIIANFNKDVITENSSRIGGGTADTIIF